MAARRVSVTVPVQPPNVRSVTKQTKRSAEVGQRRQAERIVREASDEFIPVQGAAQIYKPDTRRLADTDLHKRISALLSATPEYL